MERGAFLRPDAVNNTNKCGPRIYENRQRCLRAGFLNCSKPKKSGDDMTMINRLCKVPPALPTAVSKAPMSTPANKIAPHKRKSRELRETRHVKDQEARWDVCLVFSCGYFKRLSWLSCFKCTLFKELSKFPNQSSGNSGTEVGTLLLFE